MSLKKIVTHIFIWTLLLTLPPPGGIRRTVESSMRTALCRSWNGRLAVHGRMSKTGTCHRRWKIYIEMKAITIHKWIFLLSWCLIKIPPRFTESRFQPTSQTFHRRQIGNEFTQGIGGRKAGFGEFWGTWGIEHIRNDEEGGMVEYKLIVEGFFEFYMFPSFRLNVSWSLLPVFFLHSGCYWVKNGYSSVAPIPSNNYDYVTDLPWESMNKHIVQVVPVVALMLLKFWLKNLTSPDQGSFLVLVIGGR